MPHIQSIRLEYGDEIRVLAIVKKILDLHDSRITVVSKIDSGTRFEFELPRHSQAA